MDILWNDLRCKWTLTDKGTHIHDVLNNTYRYVNDILTREYTYRSQRTYFIDHNLISYKLHTLTLLLLQLFWFSVPVLASSNWQRLRGNYSTVFYLYNILTLVYNLSMHLLKDGSKTIEDHFNNCLLYTSPSPRD